MNEAEPALSTPAAPDSSLESFDFRGEGGEYFRIWIVNLFLTIITLGIYSAWAKVRTNRYFYGSTRLQGQAFSYLASPINILKGRAIALGVLLAYSLAQQFVPAAGLGLSLLLMLLFPWLIRQSLRFRAHNSAWRNVRFGFHGNVYDAGTAFYLWPMAAAFTLGLLMPLALKKQNEYMVNYSSFGTTDFVLEAPTSAFFRPVFGAALLVVLGLILLVPTAALAEWATPAMMLLIYLAAFAWYKACMFNTVYGNSVLGEHRFVATMSAAGYTRLLVVNIIGIILTLGLFYPFARIRTARYTAEHLKVKVFGSSDEFVAAESEKVTALGEELGDALDLDIGL